MQRRPLTLLALACLVLLTFAVAATVEVNSKEGRVEQWTDDQAEVVAEVVAESLKGVTTDLEAVAAFVEQSDPDEAQFAEFVDRIDGTASAVGVGYLTELEAEGLDAHIAARRQVLGDYYVFGIDQEAEPVPIERAGRQKFYPVRYFALGSTIRRAIADDPEIGNIGAGLDAGFDPVWRADIARALEVDEPTFSGFTALDLEFVTLDRVFFASVPVAPTADRPRGLVVAMMVEQLVLPELDRKILDNVSWEAIPPGAQVADVTGPNARMYPLELPGTTWSLAVAPTDRALSDLSGTAWWITPSISSVVVALIALALWLHFERRGERKRMNRLRKISDDKDRFLASVSHELRTPLTVVSGLAYELHDQPSHFTPEERDGLMEMLVEQTDELTSIVEDLLVAARSDIRTVVVHCQEVDLHDLVNQVMESTGIDASTRGEPGHALADPQRVRQILRNLLTNAKRYGGPQVRIDYAEGASWVEVSVADNGAGIPLEKRQSVFEPYESAHAPSTNVNSVGLGLYIARSLARAMGGDIEYAYDGSWSHFRFRLPSAATPRAPLNDLSHAGNEGSEVVVAQGG